jgi:hypothetical protein
MHSHVDGQFEECHSKNELDITGKVQLEDACDVVEFTWEIQNVSELSTSGGILLSEPFEGGGCTWRIQLSRNGCLESVHVALILEKATLQVIPIIAKIFWCLKNSLSDVRKEHCCFFEVGDFSGPHKLIESGMLESSGAGTLMTKIKIYDYNSKEETGYVGIFNQGATCYVNSLLQCLFQLVSFRRDIFAIEYEEPGAIVEALQAIFYNLQNSGSSVSARVLTKALGWNLDDASVQQDVQEFSRILMGALQNTSAQNTIKAHFQGRFMTYVKCQNILHHSVVIEEFLDLSLNVKGFLNLQDSFRHYVDDERLEGENQFRVEEYGLQDAVKGIKLIELPPVLQIQLKRF